ncbi:hypothetical protein V8B97DRAFT_1927891 [Scleroderma yunnanense]
MLFRGPEHARSTPLVYSRGGSDGRFWFKHTHLPGSTWTVLTSYAVRENSSKRGG